MAMLGDMLAAARDSTGGFEAWLRRVNPALAAATASAAAASGLGLGGYARMAVADFSRLASEEDWATLLSRLRSAEDPGSACLAAMVQWRLSANACAAHRQHEGSADG